MKRAISNDAVVVVAVLAFLLLWPSWAHGQQSQKEAMASLTTGAWHADQSAADHVMIFKPDGSFTQGTVDSGGTFTTMEGAGGMWLIRQNCVILNYWQWPDRRDTYDFPIDPQGAHGVDEKGHPVNMRRQSAPSKNVEHSEEAERGEARQLLSVAAPTPAFSSEMEQRGRDAVKKYRDSIVFVTGKDRAGSGFIAHQGGTDYLISNAHVVAGIKDANFKALDGAVINSGKPSIAQGEDLFRMEYPRGNNRFEIMEDVDKHAAIGDEVVVLGNAEGEGVVNTLYGKIVGIGPDLVEVSAPFVPGNSGSPIIHLKSGKVIGVATYMRWNRFAMLFDGTMNVRRFGYRLDSVKTWEPVDWATFKKEAGVLEELNRRTDEIFNAFASLSSNNSKGSTPKDDDLQKAISLWRSVKKKPWKKKAKANEVLAKILHAACVSDVKEAEGELTYDYFKQELTVINKERDQLAGQIWSAIYSGIK